MVDLVEIRSEITHLAHVYPGTHQRRKHVNGSCGRNRDPPSVGADETHIHHTVVGLAGRERGMYWFATAGGDYLENAPAIRQRRR